MEKVKIVYLITKSSWGGAQRYVFDLATNLPKEQYEPVVITGTPGLLNDELDAVGIQNHSLKSLKRDISILAECKSFISLFRLIRQERPQVLHVNSSKAGAMGALIGRLLFVPRIVFTSHAWSFNEDRPRWQKFTIKCIHWFTIVLSHKTIAVSNGLKADFAWPLVERKMIVINPGREVSGFETKENARGIMETKVQNAEANLHDFHHDLWIGTIAELHPTKQLNRLIDSLAVLTKDHPPLRLILIHDGDERHRLEQQVKDLGLPAHVFFTGTLKDAARLLPAFDIFALPSRTEAFGYVLVEAGLAGVPVVATRVGGITDVITHEKTGLLVPPEDTPALTDALTELINDKELRYQLAEAGKMSAAQFTLGAMLEKTLTVYQKATPQ